MKQVMKKIGRLVGGLFFVVAIASCQSQIVPAEKVRIECPEVDGLNIYYAQLFKDELGELNLISLNHDRDQLWRLQNGDWFKLFDLNQFNREYGTELYATSVKLINEHVYIGTYSEDTIIKIGLRDSLVQLETFEVDNGLGIYTWLNSSPIVGTDSFFVIPVAYDGNNYEEDPDELAAKFTQPKAAVFRREDRKLMGYVGAFNERLKTDYFLQTFHFQSNYKDGFALSGFIDESIKLYNGKLKAIGECKQPSEYFKPLSVANTEVLSSEDKIGRYLMEGFSYGPIQFDSGSEVLMRVCLLEDDYLEDGLIKDLGRKAFSIQLFEKGKFKKEHTFFNSPYSYDAIQIFDNHIYFFINDKDSSDSFKYHVYKLNDLLR